MVIAIASGKGGTGKTTVACNLAKITRSPVHLLDCDVGEPNDAFFIGGDLVDKSDVSISVPSVNEQLCTKCGACSKFCQYNAIITLPKKVIVYENMCHSCGGWIVCPYDAINLIPKKIGEIKKFRSDHITLIQGQLRIGNISSPQLISSVKENIPDKGLTIIDAPPGNTCPAIEAVDGVDYVVLVTEPTPFGLHDLKLSVLLLERRGIPFGVVINRDAIGDDKVEQFCNAKGIQILARIPNDMRIAKAYSRGETVVQSIPEYSDLFRQMMNRIECVA